VANPLREQKTGVPAIATAQSTVERRQSHRFPFTASTTVTEISSKTRVQGRNSDLSLGGCYVDTLSPFPVGAIVQVTIEQQSMRFEAVATVVYAHVSLGMGLRFTKISPENEIILRAWVVETGGQPLPVLSESPSSPEGEITSSPSDLREVFTRLITIMEEKKLLTANESQELLRSISRALVPR
jgi:PilZ domain-containing protein